MQYIDYAWYRVELHLAPSSARELVGDMKFSVHSINKLGVTQPCASTRFTNPVFPCAYVQLYTYNLSFSTMELGLRLAYLFVALLAMMVRRFIRHC